MVLRFLLSYAFCLIISIVFFSSSFFASISLSRSFVSGIAVMNFEISKSSAVYPSTAHSFQFLSVSARHLRVFQFRSLPHLKSSCISVSLSV